VEFIGGRARPLYQRTLITQNEYVQVSRVANKKPARLININEDKLSSTLFYVCLE
jgi:hypothetical protein